jgi:predicted DNA-binding transcriptional regulator YafY
MAAVRVIQEAVTHDRRLVIGYRLPTGLTTQLTVDAYALVAKAGDWYLVYRTRRAVRARRVAELLDVTALNDSFTRAADFDLERFWQQWCAKEAHRRSLYHVTLRVAPSFRRALAWHFGDHTRAAIAAAVPDADGWITIDVACESLEDARARILACGRGVRVVAPEPLRRSVIDYAEQIIAAYRDRADSRDDR